MRGRSFIVAFAACLLTCCFLTAEDSPSAKPGSATTTCNFDNQKQLAVEYQPISLGKEAQYPGHGVPYGKVWGPGKQALTLFTNSPISIGGNNVPVGAYTMYLVPEENKWMLIISKNTDVTATYDKSKGLLRAPMQTGQLLSPEPDFSVYFAHTGPKECTMRVDVADTRAWVPFEQK